MQYPVSLLIDGPRAPLHATYFGPQAAPRAPGDVLFVPPFAEEMNRCRAMVAMQARELARLGIGTLVLDLFGTGDSAGDFVDATWDQWLADLRAGLDWLRRHGQGCSSLWGLRLGAVLASQLAAADPAIDRLLLWQPVLDGKAFFTQFLRIRIAADMNLPDRVKTTGEWRQRLAGGESAEISGYRIGPALAQQIDAARFDAGALRQGTALSWFEVVPEAGAEMAPASAQAIERLRGGGARIDAEVVTGPAFWHVHERELAPALIEATTRSAAAWGGRAPSVGVRPDDVPGHAERPLFFACGAERLSAVLHLAEARGDTGVVVVVAGGPQYRAGAHRQFVALARRLVASGFPVLRFDLQGMGDSSGTHRGYTQSEADIRAAVDALLQAQPQLRRVVLLGECESASGILFYAWRDPRVQRAVLINPWVRTEEGRAQAIVRHYYLRRLLSREFWTMVFKGQYRAGASLSSLVDTLRAFVRGRIQMARHSARPELDDLSGLPLPVRVAEGLRRFDGRCLLLMSSSDLIAQEFDAVTSASRAWDGLLQDERLTRIDIEGADHTFSREVWKQDAAERIARWLEATAEPARAA